MVRPARPEPRRSSTGRSCRSSPPHGRPPTYELPPHARQVGRIELWSEALPEGGWPRARRAQGRHRAPRRPRAQPDRLARRQRVRAQRADLVPPLPGRACAAYSARGAAGPRSSTALQAVLAERVAEAGSPPEVDLVEAATLYQTLYWVARTAAAPTPPTDVLHVTAAGWAIDPRARPQGPARHADRAHRARRLRARGLPGRRAQRGLPRAAASSPPGWRAAWRARPTSHADVVSPVTDANAYWEEGLGIDPDKIHVLYNGLSQPPTPSPPPGTLTVVSVGRIDPLKDVHTMLRVARGDPALRARRARSCTTGR